MERRLTWCAGKFVIQRGFLLLLWGHVGVTILQRGVFVIFMRSPGLERSNPIETSEKQSTCSRTKGFLEKRKDCTRQLTSILKR